MQIPYVLKRILVGAAFTVICLASVGTYQLVRLYAEVRPTIRALPGLPARGELTSEVFDRNHHHIADLSGEKRYLVTYNEIPSHVIKAFVSAEDKYFFEHSGINPFAMLRALWVNTLEQRRVQGASTITQQLTRILFLSQEKSLERKLKEVFLSLALERALSKRAILTRYLNSIYFGNHAYGIEAAARRYFNKTTRELDLAEAALLAGVVRAPSYYAPHRHWQRAKARQLIVLQQMLEAGYISARELDDWQEVAVVIVAQRALPKSEHGFPRDLTEKELGRKFALRRSGEEGLKIETSIDRTLQRAAERTLTLIPHTRTLPGQHQSSGSVIQAALISMAVDTGAIVALQGSTSYDHSQFNRALHTARPMAGLILPFVLATALEQGLHALTPLTPKATFYDAFLAQNLPQALPMLALVGSGSVHRLASSLSIPASSAPVPLGLGQTRASPLQLAIAFSAFFNKGRRIHPHTIQRLTNAVGQRLYQKAVVAAPPVLREETAYIVQELLKDNHKSGKHQRIPSYASGPVAGMITASADLKNAWFAGATGRLVHVLWIGGEFERHKIAADRARLYALVGKLMSHYFRSGKDVITAAYPFTTAPIGKVSFARVHTGPRDQRSSKSRVLPFAVGHEPGRYPRVHL